MLATGETGCLVGGMILRTAALTDIGRVREENEDRCVCDDALRLYAVADGIGGLPAGAQAAQLAVDALREAVQAIPPGEAPDWRRIVHLVNHRVFKLGCIIDRHMGIGCTLLLSHIRNGVLELAHVGDSTGYRMHAGALEKLTTDHNVENELRRRAAPGEPVQVSLRQGQALTRCIGQPTPPEVDVMTLPLLPGDRFLLCTDGISRVMSPRELEDIVRSAGSPEALLRLGVDMANSRGGGDNATGVAIFVDGV